MVRFLTMRLLAGLIVAQVLGSAAVATAGDRTADEARPRVEHHLLEAEQIVRHFESVIAEACPRFDTAAKRRAYVDGDGDRVVLLVAHLEEAWSEAKRTSDKDVRRAAKAPRAQVGQAQSLGHEARVLRERRRGEPGAASGLAASRTGSATPAGRDCSPLIHRRANSTSASSSPPDTAA